MTQQANSLSRQERLLKVADMRLRSMTTRAIAAELDVSHTTIANDIKKIELQWLEASSEVIGTAKGREVARLELAIREAWEAWHRSKQPHVKIVEKTEMLDDKPELVVISSTKTTTYTAGDSRFLDLVITASSQIAQILGLNSAAELKVTIEQYIAKQAAELGISADMIQREMDEVASTAYQNAWGSGPA